MTVGVVFDSAGTLLRTFRVAKDVVRHELLMDVETTLLTFTSPDRVLLVLHAKSRELMAEKAEVLLSEYLTEHHIGFGIACSRRVITADMIGEILYHDQQAQMGDIQECIRTVWDHCRKEAVVAMDSGAIVDLESGRIEYVITSGGRPFRGAKDTITNLHRGGIATYIASGDRGTKLEKIADYLGIPRDHVFGIATPEIKAQIVQELKREHGIVVMVGDGINDLAAFARADIAILTEQQPARRPQELYAQSDFVVSYVSEVVDIIQKICVIDRNLCSEDNTL